MKRDEVSHLLERGSSLDSPKWGQAGRVATELEWVPLLGKAGRQYNAS